MHIATYRSPRFNRTAGASLDTGVQASSLRLTLLFCCRPRRDAALTRKTPHTTKKNWYDVNALVDLLGLASSGRCAGYVALIGC